MGRPETPGRPIIIIPAARLWEPEPDTDRAADRTVAGGDAGTDRDAVSRTEAVADGSRCLAFEGTHTHCEALLSNTQRQINCNI